MMGAAVLPEVAAVAKGKPLQRVEPSENQTGRLAKNSRSKIRFVLNYESIFLSSL
jgi:hypothetical protein